ncbi:MAG: nitroreductase family protein, partial [Dysgonamonadaceae bacterium]|nr:nitroreductase family protein [Dysgonamonadaceae bacterium]
SVRTYTGEPLSSEHQAQIKQYISRLRTLWNRRVRIELINIHADEEPVKLGTYGWIKGANNYLAMIYEEAPFAETAAAYLFEQVILYCTSLGLGTCWLGGSFSRSDFKKQVPLKPNERLKIVSPVGYPAGTKLRFLEKYIVNADRNHTTRRPFGEIFFDSNFDCPLTQSQAGIFAQPLEMVRLAPSASNKQEWRIVLNDNILHFYKVPYLNFESIDIGIALCHFEQTCKELKISGAFEFLENYPRSDKARYVVSWVW